MIQRYAKFWFFSKDSGNSFSTTFFCLISQEKYNSCYILLWPNFIVWWPLFLETLGNMGVAIIFFPGCDVINFDHYMAKKPRQKSWEREKVLRWNKKSFFVIFQWLSVAENCLRPPCKCACKGIAQCFQKFVRSLFSNVKKLSKTWLLKFCNSL